MPERPTNRPGHREDSIAIFDYSIIESVPTCLIGDLLRLQRTSCWRASSPWRWWTPRSWPTRTPLVSSWHPGTRYKTTSNVCFRKVNLCTEADDILLQNWLVAFKILRMNRLQKWDGNISHTNNNKNIIFFSRIFRNPLDRSRMFRLEVIEPRPPWTDCNSSIRWYEDYFAHC